METYARTRAGRKRYAGRDKVGVLGANDRKGDWKISCLHVNYGKLKPEKALNATIAVSCDIIKAEIGQFKLRTYADCCAGDTRQRQGQTQASTTADMCVMMVSVSVEVRQ